MKLDKIVSYSVKINPHKSIYQLKLKLVSAEESYDINFKSVIDLSAIVELLRDEQNTFFDTSTEEIVIGWEPTGENDPKHTAFGR
jgi:hypothetical protein